MAKNNIGIDLGVNRICVVIFHCNEGMYSLGGYGLFPYDGNMDKLKKFIGNSGMGSGSVRINIEDPSLKIRRIDLPDMKESETKEAVKWSMKDVVGGDVDDYLFRYVKIGQRRF